MRPKKLILLVGGDEIRTSTTRYMLMTRGYAVTAALDANDALTHLAISQWDLVLCDMPMPGVKLIADTAHACFIPTPTLLIVGKGEAVESGAFASIQERALGAADLVERIRVITARKRGPRKGTTKKPVASVGMQLIEGELVGVA